MRMAVVVVLIGVFWGSYSRAYALLSRLDYGLIHKKGEQMNALKPMSWYSCNKMLVFVSLSVPS